LFFKIFQQDRQFPAVVGSFRNSSTNSVMKHHKEGLELHRGRGIKKALKYIKQTPLTQTFKCHTTISHFQLHTYKQFVIKTLPRTLK